MASVASHGSPGETSNAGTAAFTFGGARFLVGGPASHPDWSRAIETAAGASSGPVAATIRCRVTEGDLHKRSESRRITWRWRGATASVSTAGVSARLIKEGRQAYSGSASVVRDHHTERSLASALAAAVVSAEGGLLLHAAAVELDGSAILFIGPSGSGKTTACNLIRGAKVMSVDRVALVRPTDRWFAWAWPGGDGSGLRLERSAFTHAPLRAILVVQRAHTASPVIDSMSSSDALVAVRASAFGVRGSAEDERRLLGAALELGAQIPVGVARTVLGKPLDEPLRAWLPREAEK